MGLHHQPWCAKNFYLGASAVCDCDPVKKVALTLTGLDGNAFVLMGAFQAQAKKEGWTDDEIKAVLDDCMSGNYDHLLRVLMAHCEGHGM